MIEGYPLMLNIAGRTCIVVGGGQVAARKVEGLLAARTRVIVISPIVTAALRESIEQERIQWIQQPYEPGLLTHYQPMLVFAATDDASINRQIAQEAKSISAFVNVVDQLDMVDFINMAVIRRPPLTIALSSDGTSPALTHHLKTVIEQAVGEEYATLADWLNDLRPQVAHTGTQPERQQLYETLLNSDVPALLRQNQTQAARDHFQRVVQAWETRS